jgi:hypothetical protein
VRRGWLSVLVTAGLCVTACRRPVSEDPTVCVESRQVECVTPAQCYTDQRRGCKVCRCDEFFPNHHRRDREPTEAPPLR